LTVEDGLLHVADLRSSNGTYLNGHRVSGRQIVRPGDHLEIGPLTFAVHYELGQAGITTEHLPVAQVVSPSDVFEVVEGAPDDMVETQPKPIRVSRRAPVEKKEEELEPSTIDLDAEPIHLPEGENFRDILSGMDSHH
jgi:pSer/pThr/pTyr-binding forkhead associated (FHA) protein